MSDSNRATAASVMDPHPTVLHANDVIRTAARFIMANRYRNLPVVDDEGRYIGVFGVNCLLRQTLPKAVMMDKGLTNVGFINESVKDLRERFESIADKPISSCITGENPTVTPDTPLIEALYIMYQNRISVPVVDPETKKLVGAISYWDVGRHVLVDEG